MANGVDRCKPLSDWDETFVRGMRLEGDRRKTIYKRLRERRIVNKAIRDHMETGKTLQEFVALHGDSIVSVLKSLKNSKQD